MRDPTAAAHVLGKLLTHVGEDRVVWGTDSIWFGTPQDQIQAFRTFQISPELQERHGYPEMTDALRRKVFGLTSAALYDIEVPDEHLRGERHGDRADPGRPPPGPHLRPHDVGRRGPHHRRPPGRPRALAELAPRGHPRVVGDAADGGQFHLDPRTYVAAVEAEVPAYRALQDRVGRAARAAGAAPGDRVLDLGVGTGETSRALLAHAPGVHLVGVDESAAMVALAREQLPEADLRVTRLQDPLPEGPFAAVISALAVHHLDPGEKSDLFRRIADALAPGGRFVLADVVVPDDPSDAVIPLEDGVDRPSPLADQLRWLADVGLRAEVAWSHQDLAVVVARA